MKYSFTIGRLYKVWDVEMIVSTEDNKLTFSEHLVHPEYRKEIWGRSLSVLDIPSFEEAVGVFVGCLDEFLAERYEKGLLTIDSMKRLCELHRIKYEESGTRLVTAYRNHIKEIRESVSERESRGRALCRKAALRRDGLRPGIPQDYDEALRLLNEAIALDYLPAYGQLALLCIKRGLLLSAKEIAEKGVSRGDGSSMIVLGDIMSGEVETETFPTDYQHAAQLYISACEKGYCHKATPRLRRLINLGEYLPKGNLYMRLVMYEAKRNSHLRDSSEEEYYLDPDYREMMRLKKHNGDESSINQILVRAVEENGKTWLSGFLAASYMRLQKWGKAAQTAMKGIEGGVGACYGLAAQLSAMGADFTGGSDNLGTPDYDTAIAWSIKSIEGDFNFGFVMLNHLIAEGHLDTTTLPGEISLRLYDFNVRSEPERININNYDIDCSFIRKTT